MSSLDSGAVTGATAAATTRRAILAGTVGNLVEWFDWGVYGFFAPFFAHQFFPSDDDTAALLSVFLVFALGFFFRPLGGAVLGSYSDRRGRKAGMALTILLMAGSSLVIGVLPTYTAIGLAAPVLLVLARVLQGFSAGGEFGSSSAFMVENAGGRRGAVGSWQQVSVALGGLLASALATLLIGVLDKPALESWGWRIPFLVGGVLGMVGLYMRTRVGETESFRALAAERATLRAPLLEVVRRYPVQAMRVAGIVAAGSVTYYLWLVYMPSFASLVHKAPKGEAQLANTITLVVFIVALPFSGMLADRWGRKPMLLAFALGSAVAVGPLLLSVGSGFWSILLVSVIGALLLAGYSGCLAAVMAEQFPPAVRTVGIGLPYGISVAIFGGLTPYLTTWLVKNGWLGWLIGYAIVVCLASAAVYARMPETKDAELR
ncbi:MFS transporter [Pseudonocardia acaciae]|uniref:MFS transporter n=1 Tax=Pseudonocardia acaciae TaxID=551276 RepID=UPI00055C3617|nr:MFS transporter [Pseudonocardia acaciae]